jgi:hypothetical protein
MFDIKNFIFNTFKIIWINIQFSYYYFCCYCHNLIFSSLAIGFKGTNVPVRWGVEKSLRIILLVNWIPDLVTRILMSLSGACNYMRLKYSMPRKKMETKLKPWTIPRCHREVTYIRITRHMLTFQNGLRCICSSNTHSCFHRFKTLQHWFSLV